LVLVNWEKEGRFPVIEEPSGNASNAIKIIIE